VAAAMAVKGDLALRSVNIRDLQKQLVKAGNLPASVLNEGDSYPFPKTKIAAAVKQIPEDYGGLEVVMAQPEDSLPLLRAAYTAASGEAKLHYANTLGVMGDATGIETLLAEAKRRLKEPPPLAMPERLLWALGGTRDPRAIPALAELIGQPGEQNYRAIVVSLGRMANPAGMPVLVDLLQKAKPDTDQELITACALYRCGDKDGLAKRTLERIAAGSNSPFSRLAWQVLSKR